VEKPNNGVLTVVVSTKFLESQVSPKTLEAPRVRMKDEWLSERRGGASEDFRYQTILDFLSKKPPIFAWQSEKLLHPA
jgi:hypothetical protein